MYFEMNERFPHSLWNDYQYKIKLASSFSIKISITEFFLHQCERLFGETDILTCIATYYLGHWKMLQKDYLGAKHCFLKALQLNERKDNELTLAAIITNTLSFTCLQMSDFYSAHQFQMEHVDILMQLYGKNHPLISIAMENAGILLYHLHNQRVGREYFYQSLNIKIREFGSHHPLYRGSLLYGERYYPGTIQDFALN